MLTSVSQHTLQHAFTVTGVGVHSGAPTTMKVCPAPASTGIIFVRTDVMDKNNVIPARWNAVVDTKLCTVLANKAGVTISTVEHLMSAFAALGIDNAIVEIDGPEVPIMDGSAVKFVQAIDKAGLLRQNERRRVLRIRKTVSYQEGEKEVFLSPAEGQFFGFEISFDNALIGRQKFTHQLREDAYRADISAARTFGFLHEVEALRKMGLARGGSLENAIVIDGDKIMNPGGLRYKNEFVRHKILDAIGDLYLMGVQMIGHYHGVKAGHAMNNKILHVLFSQPDAFEIDELGDTAPQRVVPAGAIYNDVERPVSVVA
ncbi:MAG TPA: UDP-3-O-acyl-N-acetylglucosamine deacetylase [Patescibacteria group bacterium]|nr:UDP-3-O-acyl-N-acetylglucosamine deacetylase [Patescibacteria group bacterium]